MNDKVVTCVGTLSDLVGSVGQYCAIRCPKCDKKLYLTNTGTLVCHNCHECYINDLEKSKKEEKIITGYGIKIIEPKYSYTGNLSVDIVADIPKFNSELLARLEGDVADLFLCWFRASVEMFKDKEGVR